MKHRFSWTLTALVLVLALAVPWAVWADNLIPDGDYATPVQPNDLALGDICEGESKSGDVLFAINRVGGGQTFANSATVTVSVDQEPANATSTMTDDQIVLPSDWVSQDNNTLSTDTASAEVTVDTTGLALGNYSQTVKYQASGAKNGGGPVDRPGNLTVTWNVIECQANQPPELSVDNDPVEIDEGPAATNTGTLLDDADDYDEVTLWASVGTIINNGDGTWGWSLRFTDGPHNSQTVTIRATDTDGDSAEVTFVLVVRNVAPSATFAASSPIDEGGSSELSFTSQQDPSRADTMTGFHYSFACDGLDSSLATTYAAAGTSGTASCSFDDNGTFTVKGRIFDKDHGYSTYPATVVVNNVAPTAKLNYPPENVNEGSSFALSLTDPYDPSSADTAAGFQYAFDCGDGTGYGAWGSSNSATCATCDNAVRTAKGRIKDKDGGVTEYTASVSVVNVAPTIDSVTAPVDPVNIIDQPIIVSVTYSDPGSCDTHNVLFEWGDGTNTLKDFPTTSPTSASHIYAEAGAYTIEITVTDDDGDFDTATVIVVVYDPSAGFATGGGWINSPDGAYAPDPSLTGKATFGFVSKYLKGATVPTGNTQFVFHAGGLNFHSSSYDWLVVNQNGANAQYKGSGSVNGVAGYQFMLWATDGGKTDVDTFRIKIWQIDGSAEVVVYDNGFNQEIASGSIVIHTGKK